ncbi:MAG: hypothetical protein JXB49_06455 [Bacteroidales bacterium]|nr:hypothetical protein [Bacteroidales bacterium]
MNLRKVISKRELPGSAYILRFEREGLNFDPGQHLTVGIVDDDDRPYSIYSGLNDDYIEVLIKEVRNGNISNKLKLLQPGDLVVVGSPHGSFTLDQGMLEKEKLWLIATGTGISPFHSFVRSFPALDYRVIHGIRFHQEAYDKDFFGAQYFYCTTGDASGNFNGRVTEYLKNEELDDTAHYFLCGNYKMLDDVYDVLTSKGINGAQIKSEGYF